MSMVGRHAADARRPRRGRGALAVFASLLVTGVAIFSVRALNAAKDPASPTECQGSLNIKVGAAPEVAEPLRTIAADANRQKLAVAGECVRFEIQAVEPGRMFSQIRSGSAESPDLWVPDSLAWIERTGIPSDRILTLSPSVAASPLVLATDQSMAEKLRGDKQSENWLQAAKSSKMALGDPEMSGPAMSALLGIRRSLIGADGEPATDEAARGHISRTVVDLLHVRGKVPNLDTELTKSAKSGFKQGIPTTEQKVLSTLKDTPAADVVPVTPKSGTVLMDYPLVTVLHKKEKVDKLIESGTALLQFVEADKGRKAMRDAGFRDFPGIEAPKGATDGGAGKVSYLPAATELDADDVLRTWTAMSLESRVLAVLDVSGSMWEPTQDGANRITVARDAAAKALSYFPEETRFGLWLFSQDRNTGANHEVVADVQPLDKDQRSKLEDKLDTLADENTQNSTTINNTMLDAYKKAVEEYDRTRTNSLIMITDGQDEAGISDQQLLDSLRALHKPKETPISVILIGISKDADMDRLRKVAKAVDGIAVRATKAEQIEDTIVDSLLQRQNSITR